MGANNVFVAIASNSIQTCLSLGSKQHDKKAKQTIGERVLIYSCFLAHNTWCHMSIHLNKGHAHISILIQGCKASIARKPTMQPVMKFSQFICRGKYFFKTICYKDQVCAIYDFTFS